MERRRKENVAVAEHVRCPSCARTMRLAGREGRRAGERDLLIFQCDCGQVFATPSA
jgi:hypothetical protein